MKQMYKGEATCLADRDQVKALEAAGWSSTKAKQAPAPTPVLAPKPAAVKPAPKAPASTIKKPVAK